MREVKIFIVLISLMVPSIVMAWGGEGHQVVALIAEANIDPKVNKAIHELLDGANISDAVIADWADVIKRDRSETRPFHFVNIPVDASGFDPARDANEGNNLVNKIQDFEKILADKSKPKAERVEALKFIVHLVGDLHQPLHTAERNGDRGGNARLVFLLNDPKATNLHTVWDSGLLRQYVGLSRIADYANTIDRSIVKDSRESWGKGTVVDWVNESFRVAVKVTYADIPADGPPPKLDEKYVKAHRATVEEQLARGGIRLAVILNRALR